MSDMADVIRMHSQMGMDDKGRYCKACNARYGYAAERELHSNASAHLAAALAAAGFGLVREAQAVALETAADAILTNDPLDFWDQHLPEGLGWQEAMSRWLKAHARAVTVRGGA